MQRKEEGPSARIPGLPKRDAQVIAQGNAAHAKPLLTPAVNTRPPIEELGMEQRLYGKNLLVKVVIAALVCSRNL
ncbi:Cell division cycle-related res2/pct1 [Gossypium arboreum]|uniref:Cell division cycle-related res2/pct1 n=1 Tax=Gossypium arboreum TaxID=29729 RepID=A0A0B0M854_GOSAR|nr:Cell division cycle-related res2/pct1 [Gossypium arboreum]